MHGQFVWYELTTPDVDGAIKFYPKFTNWGTQPFDKDYTVWTTRGQPLGGIFRLTDEMKANGVPPNWMPYVEADNVDATVAKAKSLGATVIVGPDDIPGTGRFAVVQDPQGATFGVYRSSNPQPGAAWDGTPVESRFSWHELMTSDHVAAAKFYGALFGWNRLGEMDMGNGQMYYMFGRGPKMFGGMFTTPSEMAGMHPFWLCYIYVKDVARAVTIATKAGATVVRPQMDIPGGSIAILADPQGAGIAVHQQSAAPAAPEPAPAAKPNAAAAAKPKAAAAAKPKAAAAKKAPAKKAVAKKKAAPKKKAGAKKKAAPKKKAAAKKKAAPKRRVAAKKKAAPRKTRARGKK
jgi:uncharacterized protein